MRKATRAICRLRLAQLTRVDGVVRCFRASCRGVGVGVGEKLRLSRTPKVEVAELSFTTAPAPRASTPQSSIRRCTDISRPKDEEIVLEFTMALKFFRQLYSLDTLDTRFIVPATAPPKEALEGAALDPAGPLPVQNGRATSRTGEDSVQPPRWNTPEFYFYYVSVGLSVFMMFKLVLDVSKGLTAI